MSSTHEGAQAPAIRPLPPTPNLEFEHKEAKALLRLLRAGDPDALARARERHDALDASAPDRIRLADAQLVIAREYGFTSWPRLVQYFGAVERQRKSVREVQTPRVDFYEESARGMLAGHRARRTSVARTLAAYVPRFYAMRADDVFAITPTEDEARLAVARTHGFSSWEALLEGIATHVGSRETPWKYDPMLYAGKAMGNVDLDELKRVIAKYPELLHPSEYEASKGRNLLAIAFSHDRKRGGTAMQPIIEWLAEQGLDPQLELNRQLLGHRRITTEKVRWLLERGADANWIAPNGIPVLEHALIRYENGEAVDLVAARTVPRAALWVAAGLGDVDGVRRFLDADGNPTPAARRLRPDFDAIVSGNMGAHPDPEDEEVLAEAFYIALSNGRTAVLEYMVSRGFPVDSVAIGGTPLIHFAIGNTLIPMVECLLRSGANLDAPGSMWKPGITGRGLARELHAMRPTPASHRIAELCGLDPDAILVERDAQPLNTPGVDPRLQTALELAGDDAFRLGQADIRDENLLFGLFRSEGIALHYFTKASRMDLERFREDVAERVAPGKELVDRPKLPIHPDAQATIQAAIAIATEKRREQVGEFHLLRALLNAERGPAAELLARYGASADGLKEHLNGVV